MYFATVNWYDSIDFEDHVDHVAIIAANWNEAMLKITTDFTNINSVSMEEYSDNTNVVFIPNDCWERVKDYNS